MISNRLCPVAWLPSSCPSAVIGLPAAVLGREQVRRWASRYAGEIRAVAWRQAVCLRSRGCADMATEVR